MGEMNGTMYMYIYIHYSTCDVMTDWKNEGKKRKEKVKGFVSVILAIPISRNFGNVKGKSNLSLRKMLVSSIFDFFF